MRTVQRFFRCQALPARAPHLAQSRLLGRRQLIPRPPINVAVFFDQSPTGSLNDFVRDDLLPVVYQPGPRRFGDFLDVVRHRFSALNQILSGCFRSTIMTLGKAFNQPGDDFCLGDFFQHAPRAEAIKRARMIVRHIRQHPRFGTGKDISDVMMILNRGADLPLRFLAAFQGDRLKLVNDDADGLLLFTDQIATKNYMMVAGYTPQIIITEEIAL